MIEPTFKLTRVQGSPVSNNELIVDLQRIAKSLNSNTVSQTNYATAGVYEYSTVIRRFGSWNAALQLAGLALSNENGISDERLFENLLDLWQHLGRQPRRSELTLELSKFSQSPYNRRFGSWTASLEAFVSFANGSGIEPSTVQSALDADRRTTGRDPSLRRRW
jgi:hypothetical protein